MPFFAEIRNGVVTSVIDTDAQPTFDARILRKLDNYIECPADVRAGWRYSAGEFMPPPPVPLEDIKSAKIAEIAAARYAAETGGTSAGGMSIATDRESQAMITGAALQATLDPSYTCRWKTPQGFVTLDAKTIIGAASAVRAHVQSCFDREAELCAVVEAAETPEEVAAISW